MNLEGLMFQVVWCLYTALTYNIRQASQGKMERAKERLLFPSRSV